MGNDSSSSNAQTKLLQDKETQELDLYLCRPNLLGIGFFGFGNGGKAIIHPLKVKTRANGSGFVSSPISQPKLSPRHQILKSKDSMTNVSGFLNVVPFLLFDEKGPEVLLNQS